MARSFAFFDLDHTLLPFDTQALFCNYVLHRRPWRVCLHLLFLPFALGRACGLVSTETAKRAFNAYLWRMRDEDLRRLAHEFAATGIEKWTYPDLRAEILRHRHQGRVLVLNTASPDFYAHEIATVLGFDHCVATRFPKHERFPLLPRLPYGNNKRDAKITAMVADVPGVMELTDRDRAACWSYSDSHADLPLLEFTGNPIVIHPTRRLEPVAQQRSWPILRPARPYTTRLGNILRMARQVCGLHSE
ncbi:MAG: haloacid dehalogenase-like hydrolase [Verrucomicrobiaceae bacterium]|nr:haloacid dehalogenase-like hydrolase [Verrucomicrobiaceae bacterium]